MSEPRMDGNWPERPDLKSIVYRQILKDPQTLSTPVPPPRAPLDA